MKEAYKIYTIKAIPEDPDDQNGGWFVYEIYLNADCIHTCAYGEKYNSELRAIEAAKQLIDTAAFYKTFSQ